MPKAPAFFMAAGLLLLLGSGCGPRPASREPHESADKEGSDGTRVKVRLFVMSQCPYGAYAQKTMHAVLKDLGEAVDFSQVFVVERVGYGGYDSMHGPDEVRGDVLQLCAASHYPKGYRYMDFVACMAADVSMVPGNWKACAKETGLEPDVIEACADGEEGMGLLAESAAVVQKYGITGSPTLMVGELSSIGGRTEKEIKQYICCGLAAKKLPAQCEAMATSCPGISTITVTALSDERCSECALFIENAFFKFKALFPKLETSVLLFSEDEGKALYDKVKGRYLPIFVFNAAVKNEPEFKQISEWTVTMDDMVLIKVGKIFHPLKEMCDNGEDDNGDGKTDCEDEACAKTFTCLKEEPGSLDLFVMSLCPFGRMAEKAMEDVLKHFKNELSFKLHFIVDVFPAEEVEELAPANTEGCTIMTDGSAYCSLHGYPELVENLVQVCAMKHYGSKNRYLDFIACRNDSIFDPNWEDCAEENKMDVEKIRACAEGDEGMALIRADADLSEGLGIGASPTFVLNGNQPMSVLDYEPADIAVEFCALNPKVKACKNLKALEKEDEADEDDEQEEAPTCGN
jgi:glutaredoxin